MPENIVCFFPSASSPPPPNPLFQQQDYDHKHTTFTHTRICLLCFCAGRRWTENFSIMHHPSINESFSSYSSYDLHHLFFIIRFIHNLCLIPSLFYISPSVMCIVISPAPPLLHLHINWSYSKKLFYFCLRRFSSIAIISCFILLLLILLTRYDIL